jgi:hypothetical protein
MANEKDTEKVDEQYKAGFEMAYWLQRGNTEHLDHIMKNSAGDNYNKGMQAGRKEALRYMVKERMENYKDKTNSRDNGMDID